MAKLFGLLEELLRITRSVDYPITQPTQRRIVRVEPTNRVENRYLQIVQRSIAQIYFPHACFNQRRGRSWIKFPLRPRVEGPRGGSKHLGKWRGGVLPRPQRWQPPLLMHRLQE